MDNLEAMHKFSQDVEKALNGAGIRNPFGTTDEGFAGVMIVVVASGGIPIGGSFNLNEDGRWEFIPQLDQCEPVSIEEIEKILDNPG